MAMGSGLLALALLAADGPGCSSEEATTYQVRVITLDGLEWRTTAYSRLTPVTRQGTSAIWTAEKSLATLLADRASSVAFGGKVVAAGETVLSRGNDVSYVAAVERVADGPINQSSAIAFMPRPEKIDERFAIKLAGRRLDQGVLTRLTLDETHVDEMHTVKQTETIKPTQARTTRTTTEIGREVTTTIISQTSTEGPNSLTALVQIPEVSQTRIDGEWLIPRDGVLLISLGVKTIADANGKAVARERLAIIEANPSVTPVPGNALTYPKLSMPPVPLRSYPQAIDANGVIDLPPLPEAVASTDFDRIRPDQPSPQAPLVPDADQSLARTSFDAAPPAPMLPVASAPETAVETSLTRLEKLVDALAKAGYDLDIDCFRPDPKSLKPIKTNCEKCEADSTFCPDSGLVALPAEIAGGMKLVEDQPPVALGVTVKDAHATKPVKSVLKLEEALKNPGKTETSLVPLGGDFSLEIKATLVPTPKATASQPKPTTPK